ncbi:Flp family type IVb pilin [Inquilinus sp. OTU3971]|uniref:Flp family type IVb pilin n=1 Tax=Inquilinus sp. OTU3971 TaxID=3043855 RepID=UPI00313C2B65
MSIPSLLSHFARNQSGATAIEYALIALATIGIIAGATAIGAKTSISFVTLAAALPSSSPSPSP